MKQVILFLLFATFGICAHSQEYDIYLLIGQSNMAGRGVMEPGDSSVIEGVFLLTPGNTPEPARNPLNKYSTIRKDISMQQICPGDGFSRKIHAATNRKVLHVVNARGGSSIEEWSKDNTHKNYYSEAVRRTKAAMQMGRLVAILWHQGEANSDNPEGYMAKLSSFVNDLREDLGMKSVPFIAGELAPWWNPGATKFNPVIREISKYIPFSDYISAEGTKTATDASDPHFDRASQIILGERYAQKVLQMCSFN